VPCFFRRRALKSRRRRRRLRWLAMAELLTIVEVDYDERVRCQAPGCKHSVYRRIHVVRDAAQPSGLLVLGSTCCLKLFGFGQGRGAAPSYGSGDGRRLTDEERAMLTDNTAALVARLEAEHAEELARRKVEEERAAAALRKASEERQQWEAQTRAAIEKDRRTLVLRRPQGAGWPQRQSLAPSGRHPAASLEEESAAEAEVKAAMRAEGLDPDAPGWRGLVRIRVQELLREKVRAQ
jgi:hypothetical protein